MLGSHVNSGRGIRLDRSIRRALRFLRPHRQDRPLNPTDARADIAFVDQPLLMTTGQTAELTVRIVNQTHRPITSRGSHPTRLTHTWRPWAGDLFEEAMPVDLPVTLYPGEPADVKLRVRAPEYVGDYSLECDLIQDGYGRFSELDDPNPGRRFALQVNRPRDSDIDYHDVFRTADLSQNNWWVVGDFKSREHYERSSLERREMLVRHFGLQPDSRVLDIGCGTGQIAKSIYDFLSDRGAYYGTDLAAEAIEFCRRTYTRPNFVFRVNPMTSVPIEDGEGSFDLAMFFSVFTHTHLDESLLLLGEALRLLAPGGRIIADFFVSPLVERGLGNRGAMDLNEAHFLRLTALLGLKADIFARFPWPGHVTRLMVCFTRK